MSLGSHKLLHYAHQRIAQYQVLILVKVDFVNQAGVTLPASKYWQSGSAQILRFVESTGAATIQALAYRAGEKMAAAAKRGELL